MSRKAAIVEEFDDDTDLPLPSIPLPNTGTHGPLLEELHISDDEFETANPGPASPPAKSQSSSAPAPPAIPDFGGFSASRPELKNAVTDITPYKSWTCIYPIYIDAKRPYGTGQRRVERAKCLWWPLSKDIADAAGRLGLGTLHEVNKSHPRDWENPGRVRVQWKQDGRLLNPMVKTKKQLLEMICFQIQHQKPDNIPRPPYDLTSSAPPSTKPATAPSGSASSKGKQPATTKSKSPPVPIAKQVGGRRLPIPPEPHPPLASRVSPYSPAISAGVLVETIKAGMNATEGAAPGAGAGASGVPGGTQKGKRKVVRVRA